MFVSVPLGVEIRDRTSHFFFRLIFYVLSITLYSRSHTEPRNATARIRTIPILATKQMESVNLNFIPGARHNM